MLFDTDILIFVQRGREEAAQLIESSAERYISVQTYMELLQDAANKRQHTIILDFLEKFAFSVLPFNESIGKRAASYVKEYSLSHGIRAGDALIAATATEHKLILATANRKHFSPLQEQGLILHIFKP